MDKIPKWAKEGAQVRVKRGISLRVSGGDSGNDRANAGDAGVIAV